METESGRVASATGSNQRSTGLDQADGERFRDLYHTVLSSCAALERIGGNQSEKERIAENFQEALALFSTNLAIVTAAGAGQAWSADPHHPGFLQSTNTPSARFPFHLVVQDLDIDVFRVVGTLVDRLRIGNDDSVLCVSGSVALFGNVDYCSDLDFCEYIRWTTDIGTFERMRSLAVDRSGHVLCLTMRGGEEEWLGANDNEMPESANMHASLAALSINQRRAKGDFVAFPIEGAIEVSNVVLWTERQPDSGASDKSYAYQEIPVTFNGWMPRTFGNPATVGRYVEWLTGQIKHYLDEKKFVKAAKRSLSLARIYNLGEQFDALFNELRGIAIFYDEVIAAREQCIERAKQCKRIEASQLGLISNRVEEAKRRVEARKVREVKPEVTESDIISKVKIILEFVNQDIEAMRYRLTNSGGSK